MSQVVVSSYEAASSIIIEFDMDNNIFGLPREFVVASAGKRYNEMASCCQYVRCVGQSFCILGFFNMLRLI